MVRVFPKSTGFTLLELLIAMSVFSILSIMAYGGLQAMIDTKTHTESVSNRLVQLQTTFMFIGRDVEQSIGRTVRDGFGDEQPAMKGNVFGRYLVELSRAGYRNPLQSKRSTLQRVAYRLEDDKLFRVSWPMLDQDFEQEPYKRELLDKIDKIEFRYIDRSGQLQEQWPVDSFLSNKSELPLAVEIKITLKDMGEIRRLFGLTPGENSIAKPQQQRQN